MKRKSLLISILFLLMGTGDIMSQNVSSSQMDERFNDNKMPYGWYADGWEFKDSVARKKSSTMDISSLLGGGGDSYNYLMTPPLSVQGGEVLSFSAKKGGGSDSGLGSFMGGDSDSSFVVERAVYGEHMWIKVADFTTSLDSVYKTFTISNTEAGEYRFRFRAGGSVMIDSVAGFHIDSAAPDIYPVYQDKNIQPVDLGLCATDTTITFSVINTGTGTLSVSLSTDAASYTLDNSQLSVAAADTAKVKLTFNYQKGHEGRNSTKLTFSSGGSVENIPLRIDAIISQQNVWTEDFNHNKLPKGWFTEGWEARDGVATVKESSDDGMGSMFGGSSTTYYLMTPPLTVSNENDVLLFSVKKAGGDSGMGSMFGGGGSSFIIEKSVYGSGKWEKAKDLTGAVDTVFTTQWLSYLEPGEYRFRFVASDSIVVDDVRGFQIDMNAPDLYVTLDSAVVKYLNLGTVKADITKTFTVVNTGTGTLGVTGSSLDEKRLAIAGNSLSIAAGDSAKVDVTLIHDDRNLGEIHELLTFTPSEGRLSAQFVNVTAYFIKSDAWSEDFEPTYVVEDQTFPRRFPEGWTTTGWELTDGEDGGMMAMFGMGGGEKSWGATTDSEDYELVTPRLQAAKGDILQFTADMGGGGMMAMFGMGGGSGLLHVSYSREGDEGWTLYGTYTQTGTIYFKAPYSGIYQLKFEGSSVTLDNFEGFYAPLQSITLVDGMDEKNQEVLDNNAFKKRNVNYNRVLSAKDNGDGTWTPMAYTICLPYYMDFSAYNEPGKVKLYRLQYVDRYYSRFIFTEKDNDEAFAGAPYLAVVIRDSVNLNAYGVEMKMLTNEYADGSPRIFDYEKWYLDNAEEFLGLWHGTFTGFSTDSQNAAEMYCLVDDGSWARLSTATDSLRGFRAYFFASTDTLADNYHSANARASVPITRTIDDAKTYQTKFYQQGEDRDSKDIPGLLFKGDITIAAANTTGNRPTIQTIDNDGTVRYFDLQGRQLIGKPSKGFYIEGGKKHVAP